jgi:hypothetical protein
MLLEQKKIDDGKLYIPLSPLGQWRPFFIYKKASLFRFTWLFTVPCLVCDDLT